MAKTRRRYFGGYRRNDQKGYHFNLSGYMRKGAGPRPAHTYRAARRNAMKNG